jgi:surface carbohydrate biosynthesis protein (TIGR04326 family)
MLALDDYCLRHGCDGVELATTNEPLAAAVHAWSARCGHPLRRAAAPPEHPEESSISHAVRKLPYWLQGVLTLLRFAWQRKGGWLRASGAGSRRVGVTIIDILTHLDLEAAERGKFVSGYWTRLVHVLDAQRLPTNWFHFWHRSKATPGIAQARALVKRLNHAPEGNGDQHLLVDARFGPLQLSRCFRNLMRLWAKAHALRTLDCWNPNGSRVDLAPLLRHDWLDSLCGVSAATNLCYAQVIDDVMAAVPRQPVGVYIQENQPWELALIWAWKRHGHGPIIGTPHTTVRFWDLRYYYDPRTFAQRDPRSLPIPDFIAVTGDAAASALSGGLAPQDRLAAVEALRYLHLGKDAAEDAATAPRRDLPVLLVATDLLDSNTRMQMDFMTHALQQLPGKFRVVVKPHPASDFGAERFPAWQSQVDRSQLGQLILRADIVFSSNASSAGVDAHLSGKPVLTLVDGARFNFSPLRGCDGNTFIASPEELVRALETFLAARQSGGAERSGARGAAQYFHLDPALPRWKSLLARSLA